MRGQFNLSGISTATWVRIVVLLLVLVNQIAVSFFDAQLIPFTDQEIYEGVSAIATALVSFYTAWKNNSVTVEAQRGDHLTRKLKDKGEVK